MTAETADLQERRLAVLESARATGSLPTLERFLTLDNPMQSLEADLVYAVSFSLVDYLQELGGEQRLLEFVDRTLDKDCDAALRDVYAIDGGLAELQRLWSASVAGRAGRAAPLAGPAAAQGRHRHACRTPHR